MGFWGTLAKVGGAVASGIATLPIGGPAWLTPALLAGGGILGSLGHEGGGSKEDQSRINDYLKQLAQMGVISAEQFKQFSDRANIASGETMKFLMGIVQSDPAARALTFWLRRSMRLAPSIRGRLTRSQSLVPAAANRTAPRRWSGRAAQER